MGLPASLPAKCNLTRYLVTTYVALGPSAEYKVIAMPVIFQVKHNAPLAVRHSHLVTDLSLVLQMAKGFRCTIFDLTVSDESPSW